MKLENMRAVGSVRTDWSFSGREEGAMLWRIRKQHCGTMRPRELATIALSENATQAWGGSTTGRSYKAGI